MQVSHLKYAVDRAEDYAAQVQDKFWELFKNESESEAVQDTEGTDTRAVEAKV